jgi:hypothetical protein
MPKTEEYYFHQTPSELCKLLIEKVDIVSGDSILEPFRGEGAFYDNFPNDCIKYYCEIEEGLDFRSFNNKVDHIITNPPFRLVDENNKKVNSFYYLLNYYADKFNKNLCFLGSDQCLCSLTPKRMKELNDRGLYLHKIIVCSIKKWRGRYFFMIFKKEQCNFIDYINGSF